MSNAMHRVSDASTAAGFAGSQVRGRREPRLLHVIADLGGAEHGRFARLRAAAQLRVEHELALGRESRLLVLRQGGSPQTEVCRVPTLFLPMIDTGGRVSGLPPIILAEVIASCADRTLVLLHGGLDDLLSQLTEELLLRDVPYVIVTHGFYVRTLRYSGASSPKAAPRSVQRALLEAAQSVEIACGHERNVVQRIAPLSRSRQDRHWLRVAAAGAVCPI